MSVPFGYQLYGLYVSQEKVAERQEMVQDFIAQLEENGLRVEKFLLKSGETVNFRIYNPNRALDYDEAQDVDDFYRLCGGGSCGFGFLNEVAPLDPGKWDKVYESPYSPVIEAESIRNAVPEEPDRVPSSAELIAATLAAKLNEQYKWTGDSITKMQVDAMARNIERIQLLRKSGKFRVISVDTWNHDENVDDYSTEEDALISILLIRELELCEMGTGEFPRIYKALSSLREGKKEEGAILEIIGEDISLDALREKLATKKYHPRTSAICYLYDPEGNCIGGWAI